MKIVTSGLVFLDIDAYGGCIAYAELLKLQGHDAVAYSSVSMNSSIPAMIRAWNAPLRTSYEPSKDDTFIIVDVSEPDYLDKAVEIDQVEEVIDHHLGNETYWQKKIGDKATIEFIGAACTQIFEKWQAQDLLSQMSETSARLLIAGILDNTLNFKAQVTTDRDRAAYEKLLILANLPDDWTSRYFEACQAMISTDIETALINDTKTMSFPNYTGGSLTVGQLVIWDAESILDQHLAPIETVLASQSANWFLNLVSIHEGKSYFIGSDSVRAWLENTLDVHFNDNSARAERLWLRKEIMKRSIELAAV